MAFVLKQIYSFKYFFSRSEVKKKMDFSYLEQGKVRLSWRILSRCIICIA